MPRKTIQKNLAYDTERQLYYAVFRQDGRRYTMLANFGENAMEIDLDAWELGAVGPYGEKAAHRKFALSSDEAVLIF